nr:hypothetical protein [uncultured Lacibacter sp.]
MHHYLKRSTAFFLSVLLFSNTVSAQDDFGKGFAIQAALPVKNGTFSGEDFGEVNKGNQGFYFQISRQSYMGENDLYFHSYKSIGLAFRSTNITIKDGDYKGTNLKITSVELPIGIGAYGKFFGVLPLGFTAGGYLAVPLQYEGTIRKTNKPDYAFGNKYEKPLGYAGIQANLMLNLHFKKFAFIRLMAGGHMGLIAAYKAWPEGSTATYKTPLPTNFQVGAEILFAK